MTYGARQHLLNSLACQKRKTIHESHQFDNVSTFQENRPYAEGESMLRDLFVRDPVLPGDSEDTSEARKVKTIQSFLLSCVCCCRVVCWNTLSLVFGINFNTTLFCVFEDLYFHA